MLHMGIQITIRDVNPEVFKEFKAEAVQKGIKLGTAITLAMEKFHSEMKQKRPKFTNLKPVDWGKGTKHVSQEVDAIFYEK